MAVNRLNILIFFSTSKQVKKYGQLFVPNAVVKQFLHTYTFEVESARPNSLHTSTNFFRVTRKLHALIHSAAIWQNRYSSFYFTYMAFGALGSVKQSEKYNSFLQYHNRRRGFFARRAIKLASSKIHLLILKSLLNLLFLIEYLKLKDSICNEIDLVIFPYGGRISLEFDFYVWHYNRKNIDTLGLQENWDNLSSKGILLIHPKYFATWGKQSSSHLKTIQGFNGDVFEVGDPGIQKFYEFFQSEIHPNQKLDRFDKYSELNPYILVIGSGDGIYDSEIIKTCKNFIQKTFMDDLRVIDLIYRPHPYSRISESSKFEIESIPGIIFDDVSMPADDVHRLSLIHKSLCVVALYSTVLLEASILEKVCVIPSFVGAEFNYKTSSYLDDSDHYAGMSSLDTILNVKTVKEFYSVLSRDPKSFFTSREPNATYTFCLDVDFIDALNDIFERISMSDR